MANTEKILFLYTKASVPQLILDNAMKMVPDGFTLELCENATPAGKRREMIAEADHLMCYSVRFPDIDVAGRAKILQLLSAGYDQIDVKALNARGIPVCNNGGANAPTVAEHAVMLMLSVYKKAPLHHDAMQRDEWLGMTQALSMRELTGRQVGIIGFGKIGRNVGRIVGNGFLARVVYHDIVRAPAEVEASMKARKVPLDELLATSDIVTIHTWLDEKTRRMLDAAAIRKMKKGAVLINTARGPIVDLEAVADALDSGHLSGAGIDVFDPEPPAPKHRLLGRDNVVLSPHNAGTTIDTWTRRLENAFANFIRVSKGEAPYWQVEV